MEGSLLDLDTSAPSGNQQQQQQPFDPFGSPPSTAQQPTQQTAQPSFDDPFVAPPPSSQNPPVDTPPQQQTQDFDAIFTDTAPSAAADGQQPMQTQELNFDVFGGQEAQANTDVTSTPSQDTPVVSPPAATANGSAATESSAEGGSQEAQQTNAEDVENAANEAAEATVLDYKGKLNEIEQVFGGRWRLVRSDPYAEYLKSVGVGLLTRNRASGGTPDLQISVLHEYIFVNVSSMLHSQINKYKLDEAVENMIYKTNQSVVCTYQNRRLELQMTPVDVAWSKTQCVEYSINERHELMVVSTSGSSSCRRYFAKVNQDAK